MKRKMRIGAAIGLLGCVLLLGTAFCQTQARYENQYLLKEIYIPGDTAIFSNFLASGGQTVLLEDWEVAEQSIQDLAIRIVKPTGAVSGKLVCQEDSEFVTVNMKDEILNVDGAENVASLYLALDAIPTEETVVTVRVSWVPIAHEEEEPTIWADFVVTLIPPKTEQTEPTEVSTEMNAAEQTETIVQTLPTEATDPAVATDTEETQLTEATDTVQSSPAVVDITCPEVFAWEELLVLTVMVPEGADSIILGYDGIGFPEDTRYILTGEIPCVLADSMLIEVPVQSQEQIQVILDFSWVTERQSNIIISAAAYCGEEEIAADDQTVSPCGEPLTIEVDPSGVILESLGNIELPISGVGNDVFWTLEYLAQTENTIGYVEAKDLIVELSTVAAEDGTEQTVLTISNEAGLALAGTYRLSVQRTLNGFVISSYEIPIFLHY